MARPLTGARRRRGMTLIEMLVVVAIIGILAALLLTAVAKARDNADRVSCTSNLKNLGSFIQLYATDHRGLLPLPEDLASSSPSSDQNLYQILENTNNEFDQALAACPVDPTDWPTTRGGSYDHEGLEPTTSTTQPQRISLVREKHRAVLLYEHEPGWHGELDKLQLLFLDNSVDYDETSVRDEGISGTSSGGPWPRRP